MRVSSGPARRARIKKVLKRAKGYRRHKLYRAAKETVMRAQAYGFGGRRIKKRDYRSMWIVRINAACEMRGIPYHRFINGLKKANVQVNRKMMAEMALSDAKSFDQLVETAKKALA
ncbi:MAG: 50S ribosomal protein L20 [Planctomycetes bacterium]|nr:50S ribosomal protein L20 [Planctomycetota bacterium]